MGTYWSLLTLLLILRLLASTSSRVNAASEKSTVYIVHMRKNMSHTSIMAKGAWYNEVMRLTTQALQEEETDDGVGSLHHVYDNVFDGFSARLTPEQASYMKKLPGVLSLYPNRIHACSTTRSPTFLGLTGKDAQLWNESNYGDGVIVGIIDSGIWPERPSFSDQSLGPVPERWSGICEAGDDFDASKCNRKIIGARYFSKGYEAMVGPINNTNEYKSPRDWNGHGTHSASTAAGRMVHRASANSLAEGTASGMAPKARIAIYKALWGDAAEGSTDDIIAAIDQAVVDGVDVISFSILGSPGIELHADPIGIAAYNVMKKGIFISASGGNSGPAAFTVGNIAPWLTTVAATTLDRDLHASVELGDGSILSGRSSFDGRRHIVNVKLPLIYAGDAAINVSLEVNASVCQRADLLNPSIVKGKIILCDSAPETDFNDILDHAGVEGVILGNNPSDGEALSLNPPNLKPSIRVGNEARKRILAYIRESPKPMAEILPAKTVLDVIPSPEVAGFSSRGPLSRRTSGQWLKPDIAAPGVDILAAGVRKEDYAFMSGTSMACSHVSGIGAMLKAVHPTWSPGAIRSAIMTTATSKNNVGNTISVEETSRAGTPLDFGAGLIQPERALQPGLVYDADPDEYFWFLCALGYDTLQIQKFIHGPFTCPPRVLVEHLNLPSFTTVFNNLTITNKTPVTFIRTVTNVASSNGTYTVSVEQPKGFSVSIEPSTLEFSQQPMARFEVMVTPLEATNLQVVYGSIEWTDSRHIVRSPLVILNEDLY